MTLALFPLGAIALWQTNEVVTATIQLSEEIVLSETERAAANERRLLERGRGAAEGLAALLGPVADDAAQCSDMMARFVSRQDTFVFAGFIDRTGMMECASNGVTFDFADDPSFARALEQEGQIFEVNLSGVATGESVVIISNPVKIEGRFAGFVSLSLPHEAANPLIAGDSGFDHVTINRSGRVLFSTNDLSSAGQLLPANVAPTDFIQRDGDTFIARAIDGRERLFAISSIIPDEVVVVGSWPTGRSIDSIGTLPVWVPLLFPILMWFAGLAVAFLGLHRLVIRHIYALRSAMRRFALGERDEPKLQFVDPPAEFEVLETSFNRMVQSLVRAERQAEQDLDEKTILLREIHHRVKNNLQLIASIMNMHARAAKTPETRALLSQLQQRVRGLATVHQTMNTNSDETSIDARKLIQRLVNELIPMANGLKRKIQTTTDVASVQLGQDQAVTLSMLAAEALTNAVKYIDAPMDDVLTLEITLEELGERMLRFTITNTVGAGSNESPALMESSGIGTRLIRAFVAQLDGEEDREVSDTHFKYVVTFPRADAEPAVPRPWAQQTAAS
ncbi:MULTISPECIES: sensor histidine kinase [Roseobacteraceae]|uniref:sensor histidine kinase n=1 Tax=Roseobacteraceae TaxID=2854170 RepID=UPI001C43F80C|nr:MULTISPECIES: sensor histidine kinase [Roseobacteraceae]MBV7409028.1 sensor histidine kinase [Maritimibacter sp. DP1N21-5]MBY5934285.1 sensor histidine kinase [Tateyamaria omphalii]